MRYFQLADDQLNLEVGPPQLASIQARLLQCQYLLARGRINQCWSNFGDVISLIYVLGIHRKHSKEGLLNLIDIECQKRVFWAAFALDKYLSYALSDRPQRIDLDSTDQVSYFLPYAIQQTGFLYTFGYANQSSRCLLYHVAGTSSSVCSQIN